MAIKAKKKTLKKRKLEERIAPGMVGGGIIDPGTIEGIAEAPADGEPSSDQNTTQTQIENTAPEGQANDSGQYIDEYHGTDGEYQDNTNEQYDDAENTNQAGEFNQFDGQADGGFVEADTTWQEPDWVTANADGSVQMQLPEGVDIDNGIASFPVDVANEALPLPEGTTILPDGNVEMSMPQGTEYHAEANALVLPADGGISLDQVPQDLGAFENPDGSLTVPLPEDGIQVNADGTNIELNINNNYFNEMTPEYMEVTSDGSVNIDLPENAQVTADGQVDIPAGDVHHFEYPEPNYVAETDWAVSNPDGSVHVEPVDGMNVDGGILEIPCDCHDQAPIPDEVTFNNDGTMDVAVPEGTEFNQEANSLTFPEGQVQFQDIPEEFNSQVNPDGTITTFLPEGVQFNADTGSVHVDNFWANEITPDSVQVSGDGTLNVVLPEGTQFYDDGSFAIAPEQVDFLEQDQPDFVHDADFASANGDGSYTIEIQPEFNLDANQGVLEIPNDALANLPIPEDVTINSDGTMNIQNPEGTLYDEATNSLTFPQDSVSVDEFPQDLNAHLNPDGTVTVHLADGIQFEADSNSVHLDNYWANEVAPGPVEITPEGAINVDLPQDCQFHDDGSFTIPADSADFIENPAPDYVAQGPDFIQPAGDGAVLIDGTDAAFQEHVEVNADQGNLTMDAEFVNQQFDNYIPEGVQFNNDGTITAELPTGTVFFEAGNQLIFPEGEVHLNEIPQEMQDFAHLNPDGTISLELQPGMEYQNDGTLNLSNAWANEVTPDSVHITPEGELHVDLPADTIHLADGSMVIPEGSADFIDNPPPALAYEGPDCIQTTADGGIIFDATHEAAQGDIIQVNPEAGQMVLNPIDGPLPADYFPASGQYDLVNPEGYAQGGFVDPNMPGPSIAEICDSSPYSIYANVTPDGGMNIPLPEGAELSPDGTHLTLPADSIAISQIPEEFNPSVNDAGNVEFQIQDGMQVQGTQLQVDNYWVNEITPDPIHIAEDGAVAVDLPPGTQYFDDGSFSIPPENADFIDNPPAPIIAEGPDWINANPDGSLVIDGSGTEGGWTDHVEIQPEQGTMTMDANFVNEQFDNYLPEEITLNDDGTMNFQLPEGTQIDANAGVLTFPAGEVHLDEIPNQIDAQLNQDGTITVNLPDGMNVDAANMTVHADNYWTNELAPSPVNITPDGQVIVDLPPDTMFYGEDAFNIPADSVDFIDQPAPDFVAQGPEWIETNPDGSVVCDTANFPGADVIEFNQANNTATMPTEFVNEQFHDYLPEEVTIHPDGTMTIQTPQGTQFDADTGTLTFPEGEVHTNEVPAEFQPQINANGEVVITLPQGADFDPNAGTLHFENDLVNQITPDYVEFGTDGETQINMPEGTYYPAGGGAVMPENCAEYFEPEVEGPVNTNTGTSQAA